jgi:hypothetical protein
MPARRALTSAELAIIVREHAAKTPVRAIARLCDDRNEATIRKAILRPEVERRVFAERRRLRHVAESAAARARKSEAMQRDAGTPERFVREVEREADGSRRKSSEGGRILPVVLMSSPSAVAEGHYVPEIISPSRYRKENIKQWLDRRDAAAGNTPREQAARVEALERRRLAEHEESQLRRGWCRDIEGGWRKCQDAIDRDPSGDTAARIFEIQSRIDARMQARAEHAHEEVQRALHAREDAAARERERTLPQRFRTERPPLTDVLDMEIPER